MSLQKPTAPASSLPPQTSRSGPKKNKIDLNALAERIFKLLKEEARLEHERHGTRRYK
jgi:hypothetical protein